jgi:hypothetical protein
LKINQTILLFITSIFCQVAFSQAMNIRTDLSVLRSFKEGQRFWSFGQNIVAEWDVTSRDGPYISLCFYKTGKFDNSLVTTAKSSTTSPAEIAFTNKAEMKLHQYSLGWKHYLVGNFEQETKWNLYTITGFGLLFGTSKNTYSTVIDTSLYYSPTQPEEGSGHFKRLTLDLGLGWEIPLSAAAYIYAEGKIWIPTTDYPSKFLLVNDNAPLIAVVGVGLRILF